MWHNAEWMVHSIRLELTRKGLLVKLANHYTTGGVYQGRKYFGKYDAFLNSFFPDVSWLIRRHEWITNTTIKSEMSVLFNQRCLKERILLHSHYIYIYIYIVFFGPVKPELGVIPSGQEIIHEWIFKFSW